MKRNLIFAAVAITIGILSGIGVYSYYYFYPQRYQQTETGEYVNVEAAAKQTTFPVDKDTTFIIEYYYPEEQRLLTEEVSDIPALLGCDKAGVEQYLTEYMEHLSQSDKDEGLVSFQLTGYQNSQITLRKTYDTQEKQGYYAKSFNGTIVILQSDGKTVYEYTQIGIHTLPEEIQQQVTEGYYLENDEDLYNFLENYSS
jgi:hypothetical protein